MREKPLPFWSYLLINVIVSALTTVIILSIWYAREHRNPAYAVLKTPMSGDIVFSDATIAQPTLPAMDANTLQIKNVYGNGDIQTEFIQIQMVGEGDLWLTGWQITDGKGHNYTFPRLQLNSGGTVNLYTKVGFDSVTDLFWGESTPLWNSGSTVTILDSAQQTRAEYVVP